MTAPIEWDESKASYDEAAVATLQRAYGLPQDPELHKRVMAGLRARGVFLPTEDELLAAYREEGFTA